MKTRLKKVALNLDYVKNMVVPTELADSNAQTIQVGNEQTDARATLSYKITKDAFTEVYKTEFSNSDDMKEKLDPGFKDKAKKLFGNEDTAYVQPLWEAFEKYIVSSLATADVTSAGINLTNIDTGNIQKAANEAFSGLGLSFFGTAPSNMEIADVQSNDNEITFNLIIDYNNIKKTESGHYTAE